MDQRYFKDFIKIYDEESDEGYFLEVDIQYPEKLHELHNHSQFLPERMKIEKVEKLVTNLIDKTEYFFHIRNLKPALNHGLVLKKVYRVKYIDMNTKLRQKAKNDFEKKFFKSIYNVVFGKTMDNLRKNRDINL